MDGRGDTSPAVYFDNVLLKGKDVIEMLDAVL
jgi:hypothetical protein